MYFSNKNNFFHGIMFHHFHDDNFHKKSQGSISQHDFYKLIEFVGRENILNADEFLLRFKENKLTNTNLCLTFDDCLKSQYDIAVPVMKDLNIKGFFFIYSSVFIENPDLLEIYRYFRMNFFKNVDEFYNFFFEVYGENLDNYFNQRKNIIDKRKKHHPYYTINDIKFRMVRDAILNKDEYQKLMFKMFEQKKFDPKGLSDVLFISKSNLIQMKDLGHIIGLHSHSHPTTLEKLNYNEQLEEYTKNQNIVSKILNCRSTDIVSMSHPCGSCNSDTFKVLEKLGIEIGFKQMMHLDKNMKKINVSKYEIARQNHADVMSMIN
jgi:peptidoglycan/xylan/chitin deacetylase (PgdA/CDA1 family)|tara:strand:+ start:1298 stop:2260 length:963 start_codon:yes stop_codon:yes gene_type:complete